MDDGDDVSMRLAVKHDEDELLDHIVLPRVLPQEKSSKLYETELDLMRRMVENIESMAHVIPPKTVELFQRLHRVHMVRTKDNVAQEINDLRPGDTFAMFIRLQHTAIMIHVPSNEKIDDVQNVIVSTIPTLQPDKIYKHDSDLNFIYPEQAVEVKFSQMLKSEEFANQLCVLYEYSPIGEENHDCVSKWLVTLLATEEKITAAAEYPFITKKIRDEILGNSKTNYFRRSSFYMSVKVMLQHNLTLQLGEVDGKLLYKIVMMKYLITVCAVYKDYEAFNIDMLSQLIAKMARRIEKMPLASETTPSHITSEFNSVIEDAKAIIHVIRQKIDKQTQKIQLEIEQKVQLSHLTDGSFKSGVSFEIPKLSKYMTKRLENVEKPNNNDVFMPKVTCQQYFMQKFTNIKQIPKKASDARIYWLLFEQYILYELNMENNQWDALELRCRSFAYAKYAEAKYKGMPLLLSRMLLVRLKLIAVLDQLVGKKYALLLDHKSGINSNVINGLLIPNYKDMCIALEIEKYFQQRNTNAKDPSLNGEHSISEDSFSVKYAKENSEMQKLLEDILVADENNVSEKQKEWQRGCEKVKNYKRDADTQKCKYKKTRNGYSTHDAKYCKKCDLRRQAGNVRVMQYKKLLPSHEIKRWAIVFELQIPSEIAHLREVLNSFAEFCLGDSERLKIKSDWTNRSGLSVFKTKNDTKQNVVLGSKMEEQLEELHVECIFTRFIVENTDDCVFHAEHQKKISTAFPDDSIKNVCTFKAQHEYADLQWALKSTHHTQNEVIAKQSRCGQELSISEYKNFGSLRADGHRLQLRNLYAMIETESLSFEKESVLALIMQTLWECGVSGADESIRESHIDFRDTKFCTAMIELLEKYVNQQRNNWMHHFKLFIVALVAVRAFEINCDREVAHEIAKLLRLIRLIAWEWIVKIGDEIRQMVNPNERIERDLRLKLIYVAIVGSMTFFIHPDHEHFELIIENDTENDITALRAWLQFIVSLKNSVRMHTKDETKLPSIALTFLRLTECFGIYLWSKMKEMAQNNPNEVYKLIKMLWSRAGNASFNLKQSNPDKYLDPLSIDVIIESKKQAVTIDIITGSFLVDELALSRLPEKILKSDVYGWFFKNAVFEVQADAECFSTVHKFNNCWYDFQFSESTIITERNTHHVHKELINHRILDNEFPHHLCENYSHWWNKKENCIEFRRKTKDTNTHFSKDTDIDYLFDLDKKQLRHVQSQHLLLDTKSDIIKKVIDRFTRLEHPKHILVFKSECDHLAKVKLLRMNLKFEVDLETNNWTCNELNGMRVSLTQNVGTLYGLNHGLILENDVDTEVKTILIPNGNIVMKSTDNQNLLSVSVKTEQNLHSPPFYQYKVDEFCRQLKSSDGSYASCFYLAYLHAITSHGEIEPLTGMSGTERALQILQSAYSWSSAPYEPEAVKMLKMIANLTPLRKLRNGMQLVDWPVNLPRRSAQDCFVFVAKKLLNDSQRLSGLYSKDSSKQLNLATDMKLNERDHWRCQSLNPNLKVLNSFLPHKELKKPSFDCRAPKFCEHTRTVCVLYHKNKHIVPASFNLKAFLTDKRKELDGNINAERFKDLSYHSVHKDFANLWISLYEAARKQKINREEFAVIMSYFVHRGENLDPILALQAIATNASTFEHINPPDVESFLISAGTFNAKKVSETLRQHYNRPNEYFSKNWKDTGKREKHDRELNIVIDDTTKKIKNYWQKNEHSDSFNFGSMWINQFEYINCDEANFQINEQLKKWYNNRQLDEFIKSVEAHLKSLPVSAPNLKEIKLSSSRVPKIAQNSNKRNIDFKVKLHNCFDALSQEEMSQAQDTWLMKTRETIRSASDWWDLIYEKVAESDAIRHLMQAGIFPRMVPSLLLPKIIEKNHDGDNNDRLKYSIGAWAIEIAREQRKKRIEMYSKHADSKAFLDKELEHEPHMNWMPSDYPEWLLFEIEQNLTIRRIQVEIAKRMIQPPKIKPPQIDTKHSVMQLNMGEGKTSVIVPIVAAKLANGQQACQITVLKSLFATNLKSLQQYLGGFLGQKIYIFPCRRDMPIHNYADSILPIYEECLKQKGVILTLPEYRLSFQLKIYEMIQNQKIETAEQLLAVQKWINENVRSVLDESDEILQAKYQLVYTVGDQRKPDGGPLRWTITQAILKRVPLHMKDLYLEYGKDKIEFDEKNVENLRSDVFVPCRILDESVFEALKTKLIDDFLQEKIDIDFKCGSELKEKMKKILTEKAIKRDEFLEIRREFSDDKFNTILIVSGLLRFEILKLALKKRHRVHYGVHDKGRRKMAIPFKAKDVPAEMSEFGHPDVAVCFTQLSYYYSGLNDEQLYCVFDTLKNSKDAASIYGKWIDEIPSNLIDPSIQTYGGVNLDDNDQRDELLFPLLRFNMQVIDFFCNMIFLQELKIFEKKLMCTAWDLCSDHYAHQVTGFSGTNDTKDILPLTMVQNDLKELERTNENMRQVLLHPRNQPYKNLPANVSGKQILVELVKSNIPVLLDSGALMLELNNKEVAIEWLKQATKYDAAVYFDENDTIQTIDRDDNVTPFDYSVYKGNLDKCVVYLDDVHTRGTDLKFPPEWRACVTLSGDITCDKTVQSCMRMRQLETSQSISFWASYEADIGIRKVCKLSPQATVQNKHVIEFIKDNSNRFVTANMAHWTTCALNYCKKSIAHKQYDDNNDDDNNDDDNNDDDSMKRLYDDCVDNDFAKLDEMYGEKEEAKLIAIAYKKFDKIAYSVGEGEFITIEQKDLIRKFVRKMQEEVDKKLRNLAPKEKRFTHALDEEQEKELEQEIEEQSQVERPPDAKPAEPVFEPRLEQLVNEGANNTLIEALRNENALLSIAASLANTQLSEFCSQNADAWSSQLFVTKDFQTVIQDSSQSRDEFLRPIWWIAQIGSSEANNILLLLSLFEVNRLLPAFRKSINSTLFMYRPRLSKAHSNLLHEKKLQVTGSLTLSAIDIEHEVQIGVYSGQMYFANEAEQKAYCGFLGLFPTPPTAEEEEALDWIPPPKRRKYEANVVAACSFNKNPVDFAKKLIIAHHQVLLRNSHVFSILEREKKVSCEGEPMEEE